MKPVEQRVREVFSDDDEKRYYTCSLCGYRMHDDTEAIKNHLIAAHSNNEKREEAIRDVIKHLHKFREGFGVVEKLEIIDAVIEGIERNFLHPKEYEVHIYKHKKNTTIMYSNEKVDNKDYEYNGVLKGTPQK